MSHKPTISVMMPCYNSAATLPMALGSLFYQDFTDWECVLVDDGSTDATESLIRSLKDTRIRYFKFDKNRGRAAARQFALEQAAGKYLAMLDADDWYYSDKLSSQVKAIEQDPQRVAIIGGMGIIDGHNELAGVRGVRKNAGIEDTVMRWPNKYSLLHASSLLKMEIAKQCTYDQRFTVSQDSDFLLQCLLNRTYAFSNEICYIYSEQVSVTKKKVLNGLKFNRIMYGKYLGRYPKQVIVMVAYTLLKEAFYSMAFACGMGQYVINNRKTIKPTLDQVDKYSEQKKALQSSDKYSLLNANLIQHTFTQ